jgi:acyl-CoA reductase-like NAD-dependent aldehyde dehydrogenase
MCLRGGPSVLADSRHSKFVDAKDGGLIEVVSPVSQVFAGMGSAHGPQSNGKVIAKVSEATSADVDIAVKAARKAFQTVWGTKVRRTLTRSIRADITHRSCPASSPPRLADRRA